MNKANIWRYNKSKRAKIDWDMASESYFDGDDENEEIRHAIARKEKKINNKWSAH